MHSGRNIIYECMNACCVQSVSDQSSFKCQWWCVQKKKFNGEIIIHWKRIKVITSRRLDKNLCQIQSWKPFVHIWVIWPNVHNHMHQMSFWGALNIVQEDNFVAITLKKNKYKVYMSLKDNKLACFANQLRLISGTRFVWFMICDFWKKYQRRAVFFIVQAWHL